MEFTPEQQAHIDKLLLEQSKGLFTEDELNKRVTSEVDRRVESGIQKGLETNRSKWETEFQERAKLTAEELAQKEIQEQLDKINQREAEILKRSNSIDARDMFIGAEIPKDQYEKFMDLLVTDDTDKTIENVSNFIATFNTTKNEIESKLKKEFSQVPPPTLGGGSDGMTKEQFGELTYMERIELKSSNLDLYDKLKD